MPVQCTATSQIKKYQLPIKMAQEQSFTARSSHLFSNAIRRAFKEANHTVELGGEPSKINRQIF